MSKAKRDIVLPTPEEDAAIRAGIAADPDTRERTAEEIARMRPASEGRPAYRRALSPHPWPTESPD